MFQVTSHYAVHESLKTIDDVKAHFPDGKADARNWFVASTSGVHGTYDTLDDIEYGKDGHFPTHLTVLIIHPRTVVLKFGVIEVHQDDIAYLRGLIGSTLGAIAASQWGNLPANHPDR